MSVKYIPIDQLEDARDEFRSYLEKLMKSKIDNKTMKEIDDRYHIKFPRKEPRFEENKCEQSQKLIHEF
ncbi:hypothetical protein KQX54_008771 [Cotesia glomerata]|uniref:Uncharacterized protein n=1 Tax=Cotesia glomerata TaxID=32391 RepID=A0AAV7IDZ5_COTGL|nr:hypothetical protein KQX54_008771 [Cotesia glomerata]